MNIIIIILRRMYIRYEILRRIYFTYGVSQKSLKIQLFFLSIIGLVPARTSQKAPESVAAPQVGRFEYSGMLSWYYKAC